MKIRDLNRAHDVDVIALYWIDCIRHFLAIPYEGHEGVIVYTSESCRLVDNSLNNFCLIKSSSGFDMLVHVAAVPDNLLDKMINHEVGANIEFFRRRALI